jgi:uncharacterized membrane protein YfcA
VVGGAMLGARILGVANTTRLRLIFIVVVVIAAGQMLYKGVTGLL